MSALNYAKDHYLDVAEQTEGQNAKEVAAAVAERAARLKQEAGVTHNQVQAVIESPRPAQADDVQDMERVEKEAGMEDADAETIAEAAKHLEQGAKDLEEATKGMHAQNEAHEGNVAGTAYLGQEGSQTFDAAKVVGTGTVVDKASATGVVVHEHEHTQQAEQKLAAVIIQGKSAMATAGVDQDTNDESTVTATDLTEAGAIIAQVEKAPDSFEFLSDQYKQRYSKVLGKGVSAERVRELARREDGLQLCAQEATLAMAA